VLGRAQDLGARRGATAGGQAAMSSGQRMDIRAAKASEASALERAPGTVVVQTDDGQRAS